MMNTRFLLLAAAAVIALAAVVFAATRHLEPSDAPDGRRPDARTALAVTLARASVERLAQSFEIGGEVHAHERATIMSRIVAEVRTIRVKPGDRVRAGQALVELDARDLTAGRTRAQASVVAAQQAADAAAAAREAADAALVLASATHKRVRDLRDKNSATASELDQATEGLHAAEARRKGADAQLAQATAAIDEARAAADSARIGQSYALLVAPFDGLVTEKLIDAGNMASPGLPLLTIEDTRSFRLEVRVDESRAAMVAIGDQVSVLLDGPDARGDGPAEPALAGRVSEIARALDPGAHAFVAKIDLPAVTGLRAGMFGRARFAGPARQVLGVPDAAIIRRGQLTSVFVVDASGIARLRLVTVGEVARGLVEVRAGLEAGETIVVSPPVTLTDGTPVSTRPGGRA